MLCVAVVQQVGAQVADGAFDFEALVDFDARPGRGTFAPEPEDAVGIPVAVPYPAAAIKGAAGKVEGGIGAVSGRVGERRGDLVPEGRGDFLVGVQGENPRAGGFGGGGVLLGHKPFPGLAIDLGAAGGAERIRAVVDIFVEDDNDLAGPVRYALQRPPDPPGFSAGDQADGDGKFGHSRAHAS